MDNTLEKLYFIIYYIKITGYSHEKTSLQAYGNKVCLNQTTDMLSLLQYAQSFMKTSVMAIKNESLSQPKMHSTDHLEYLQSQEKIYNPLIYFIAVTYSVGAQGRP